MKNALIGYTGFVGSNLLRQQAFEGLYNSKNIESIHGKSFDRVICAGARAEKWKANQNPAEDRFAIEQLMRSLDQVTTGEFILISTVDVYPDPRGVYEDTFADWTLATAYGRHRRMLEEFVAKKFRARIVRLPGLFGPGLKKNVIYDFLHDNQTEKIHADAEFQFYNLERLSADLDVMAEADLQLLNVATEPVRAGRIAHEVFGMDFNNRTLTPPARYDMRTRHAALFGGPPGYIQTAAQVVQAIADFAKAARA